MRQDPAHGALSLLSPAPQHADRALTQRFGSSAYYQQPSNSGPRVCEPLLQGRSCIRPADQVRPSISPGGRLRALTQPSPAPSVHPAEAQHVRRKAASRHQTLPCLPAAPHSMPPSAPAREAAARLPVHPCTPKPPVPRGPKPSRPARISLASGVPAAESVPQKPKERRERTIVSATARPNALPNRSRSSSTCSLVPPANPGFTTHMAAPTTPGRNRPLSPAQYIPKPSQARQLPPRPHDSGPSRGHLNPARGTWQQLYPTGTSPHPRLRLQSPTDGPTPHQT